MAKVGKRKDLGAEENGSKVGMGIQLVGEVGGRGGEILL
jgi:hypothetical protein